MLSGTTITEPMESGEQPKRSRRRRGSGKNRDVTRKSVAKLVVGIECPTPSTRLVAIFLNALSKPEKAFALDLLLRMAKGDNAAPAMEGGAAC
jgi:hypothetical protein